MNDQAILEFLCCIGCVFFSYIFGFVGLVFVGIDRYRKAAKNGPLQYHVCGGRLWHLGQSFWLESSNLLAFVAITSSNGWDWRVMGYLT